MSSLARPTLRRAPAAAAISATVGLALVLALGRRSPAGLTVLCVMPSLVLLSAALLQRAGELYRQGVGHLLALGILALGVSGAAWSLVVAAGLQLFGLALIVGAGGAAAASLSTVRIAREVDGGRTPWQALAGGPTATTTARQRLRRLGPLLAGLLGILVALRLLVLGVTGVVGSNPQGALLMTIVTLGIIVLGPGWALRGTYGRLRRGKEPRFAEPPDDRIVAAHLHDSVLQTLAMIQRSTGDPARMAQLARQEERGLRAWLAGTSEPLDRTTLAGAVRSAAAQVEDEIPGAVVEVLAVGDSPLDREADLMVHAAREAIRNAARHAGPRVEVLVEVDEDGHRQVFIRDRGAGFDVAAVNDDRRGVRDAILGRMDEIGGSTTIDSGPDGTEITLRLEPPSGLAG